MSSVGYHLAHLQVAALGESPTYTDVGYATTLNAGVNQDNEVLYADGAAPVSAYGAPTGEGSIEFGLMDPSMMAILCGGEYSTSGSDTTVVDRLEIPGDLTPPAIIVVAWIPNVDGVQDSAGLRLTLPNAKSSVPSGQFQQASYANRNADLVFNPDENNVLMIYEFPVTAPVFTNGVIPTNLVAPT